MCCIYVNDGFIYGKKALCLWQLLPQGPLKKERQIGAHIKGMQKTLSDNESSEFKIT